VSKRLLLYVEGQTEELFVNRILRNHLATFGVHVERPVMAITRPGPYLQRHEFEAFVIAHPDALEAVLPDHLASLKAIIHPTVASATAEDVNDGPMTHPSALLAQAIPEYGDRKASYALFTLLEAGLPVIRARCPRFDAWLHRWERWGQQS
jgi:hypothetical protein